MGTLAASLRSSMKHYINELQGGLKVSLREVLKALLSFNRSMLLNIP
jgi:hypothetical protein